MKKDNVISIKQFCVTYDVPDTFIQNLVEYDLLKPIVDKEESYIDYDYIPVIEKFMRLHYELDINFEGLDIITNLLSQINELQQEIRTLKSKLLLYENL